MTADDAKRPTLATARKIAEAKTVNHRPSDFLTKEEQQKLKESARKPTAPKLFSKSDAIIAEILARFGYETYKAWCANEITMEDMAHYLNAERARDARKNLAMEALLLSIGSSCAHPKNKHGGVPDGLKQAQKILTKEQKTAGGER